MALASARPLHAAFKPAPGRFVTRITYLCKLIRTLSLAAFLQLELFWVVFYSSSVTTEPEV
ncbi:hypothetical protein DXZ79_00185 [Yersinia rochesterensis]|uniref:Uncharacterized protein n=1 Tax=Yersinia rochesterensis TaxID=1604335 RepID=A0A8E4BJM2_9GAMM|nr:hypothetical protein DXZ79_00185 [Yersinia rochesterensis]